MNVFKYNTQTSCLCGRGCIEAYGDIFLKYGKRAAILTSKFAEGCRNYALEDVRAALDRRGIEYIVINRVIENPPVESVAELSRECVEFGAQFFVAIGGGSSIDSAKAVSLLMKHPGVEPYETFYGLGHPSDSLKTEADLPVFAVPTTAGTGAEVTGFACLTRSDTDTKLSMYPLVFCEAAFLDPEYIRHSPAFLLHSGAMDALAHGVETYLHTGSNIINRSLAEVGFKLFAGYKDALLENTLKDDDFLNMQIAAFIMGMAFMQSSTTIPHGMGYPLSHYQRVNHGLACAVFLGEYLRSFKDRTLVEPIVSACGFSDVDSFAQYIAAIMAQDLRLQVTEAELDKWTEDFMKLDFRLASSPEPLSAADIKGIYLRSLAPYMVK